MGSKYTAAQAKAAAKYDEKFDTIRIRVPSGKKEQYRAKSDSEHKSLNQYIIDLLERG